LRKNLIENNVLLSVSRFLTSNQHHYREPVFLATIFDRTQIIGCAVCAPPDGLYLSRMPPEAIPKLANQLELLYDSISQVVGPVYEAQRFAICWTKQEAKVHSTYQWFSLRTVTLPKRRASGTIRVATEDDLPIVQSWAPEYAKEVGAKIDVGAMFTSLISRRLMYLWIDEEPRCLVTVSGLTPYSFRVSALYTPPPFRGSGYAINAVAESCKEILAKGRSICIVASDITASGPMHLYQQLGFEPDQCYVHVYFE